MPSALQDILPAPAPFFRISTGGRTEILFAPGITPDDIQVGTDTHQHYLRLTCRGHEVALVCSMGCQVSGFHFSDGRELSIGELLASIPARSGDGGVSSRRVPLPALEASLPS